MILMTTNFFHYYYHFFLFLLCCWWCIIICWEEEYYYYYILLHYYISYFFHHHYLLSSSSFYFILLLCCVSSGLGIYDSSIRCVTKLVLLLDAVNGTENVMLPTWLDTIRWVSCRLGLKQSQVSCRVEAKPASGFEIWGPCTDENYTIDETSNYGRVSSCALGFKKPSMWEQVRGNCSMIHSLRQDVNHD